MLFQPMGDNYMQSLKDFLFKDVVIIDDEGKTYEGYVESYTSALDNDYIREEESIGIFPMGIELFASEIKSIKTI